MNAIDICLKAIAHYGSKNQIMVFLGELAELSQAITKGDSREAIIEEIADVQICLSQRLLIAGSEPEGSRCLELKGFHEIFTEITLQEARLVQGRDWLPLALYCLSRWLDRALTDLDAKEEAEKVKARKLKRLLRRIEKENEIT